MNTTRTLLLLLLIAVVPLQAQESFFIERIEVRNAKRVSPELVIAESLLEAGRSYSEAELRLASTRLRRLAFLLNVDFALEKGSDRGRHVLVLNIIETKPFFYLVNATPIADKDSPYADVDNNSRVTASSDVLTLGYRWFVGRRGALHAGFSAEGDEGEFQRDYASLAVGYTQYDIFGTGTFATLNLKKPIEGYGEGRISPQVVVGIPLTLKQSITLEFDETRFEPTEHVTVRGPVTRSFGERTASARWSYNTTNDPFLPSSGTFVQVTPSVSWTDDSGEVFLPREVVHTASHGLIFAVEAGASHNWALSDRNTFFGDVRAMWERSEVRYSVSLPETEREARYGSVAAGFSHSFWSAEQRATGGDSRLEVLMRFSNRTRRTDLHFAPGASLPGRDVRQVSAAWAFRNSWGALRLGGGYAW